MNLKGWNLPRRAFAWASARRQPKVTWRNLHLTGDDSNPNAFLCYSGLAANGALTQKKVARELYRRFDRGVDVWQRNLWGHNGLYGQFRQSRMWNWLFDALKTLRYLFTRRNNSRVFLIGHSTGALLAVLVAWLFQHAPRLFVSRRRNARIGGVILCAPAFRLRNKRNERLLLMVLLLYYVVCPAMLFAVVILFPDLWDLALLTGIAFFALIPRIRVPTRMSDTQPESEKQRRELRTLQRRQQYRALGLVIHFGFGPLIIFVMAFLVPIDFVRSLLWFFIGTIAAALIYLPSGEVLSADWEEEEQETSDSGYRWLPIVTAATLLPLQWMSKALLPRLNCPVFISLLECDKVVENELLERLFESVRAPDKQLVVIKGCPHNDLSCDEQLRLVEEIEPWIRARFEPPSTSSEASTPVYTVGKQRQPYFEGRTALEL